MIMSLRDGVLPSKQSSVSRGDIVPCGDCLPFGHYVAVARNDVLKARLMSLRRLLSAEL